MFNLTEITNNKLNTKLVDTTVALPVDLQFHDLEGNPIPTKDTDVNARLLAIEQTNADILAKLNGVLNTQVTGSISEYAGKTLAEANTKYPPSQVPIGSYYMAVNEKDAEGYRKVYVNNGTSWELDT